MRWRDRLDAEMKYAQASKEHTATALLQESKASALTKKQYMKLEVVSTELQYKECTHPPTNCHS